MGEIWNKIKKYIKENTKKNMIEIMASFGSYVITTFVLLITPLGVLVNGGTPDWGDFFVKDMIAFSVFFGVLIKGTFGKEKEE